MRNVSGEMEESVTDTNQKDGKTNRLEIDRDGLQMLRLAHEGDKALLRGLTLHGSEESKYQQAVADKSPLTESGHFKHEVKCFQISKPLIRVDHSDISHDDRTLEEQMTNGAEFDQSSIFQNTCKSDAAIRRSEELKDVEGVCVERKPALVKKEASEMSDLTERQQTIPDDFHVKFVLDGVDMEEDDEVRARKHFEFVELKKRLEEEEIMYAGCALGEASNIDATEKDQIEADQVRATMDGVINSLAGIAICKPDSSLRVDKKPLSKSLNINNGMTDLAEDKFTGPQAYTNREGSGGCLCCRKAVKQIDEGNASDVYMTNSFYSSLNIVCPICGIPVVDLVDPVRSEDCEHIYDRAAALNYIATKRKDDVCLCAASGCRALLAENKLVNDSRLWQDIAELRQIKAAMLESRMLQDFANIDDSDDD